MLNFLKQIKISHIIIIASFLLPAFFGWVGVVRANEGDLIWSQVNNFSSSQDSAQGIATDASGIYVVGNDFASGIGNGLQWRIEKRNLSNGSVLWSLGNKAPGGAYGVAVDASGLYVVGYDGSLGNMQWRIEKRNLSTGSLVWSQTSNPSSYNEIAYGVAVDGSGIYIVGDDRATGQTNSQLRIEKRNLSNGSLIWSQVSNPSSYTDTARGVAVDSMGVYVVGDDASLGSLKYRRRIEKRSLSNGSLTWSQVSNDYPTNSFAATGVAVNSSGVYVAGEGGTFDNSSYQWHIEKRNLSNGSLIWDKSGTPTYFGSRSVSIDASGIYSAGDEIVGSSWRWRIEKRNINDGSLIWFRNSGSAFNSTAYGIAVDSSGTYVVGKDLSPGNYQWLIEKRDIIAVGTVNVSSNISGANWTITGPSTKTGSGTSASYGSMPVGTYTITWGAFGGYNTPGSSSQTLTSGGIITFNGPYTAIPPTASLSDSPNPIAYNTASTLSWSSTNATGCTAGGAWSGAKATSGTASTGNLTSSQTYTLYCTGAGGNSSTQAVTVTVNPISDLTAGSVAPASATTGTAATFSATISNTGTASTGASFTNLFQFDNDSDHTINGVYATQIATAGPIAAGSSANASVSYTFPTAGTWYVRACADNNASWVGTITESNEGNNCGAWTNVSVTTPVPTGSITPSNCTITSGPTCTASIAWTTSNVTSPSVRNNGIQFSTAPSSAGTPVTLNYGVNTLTLYDGATWLDTKYASGFAADQGATGPANGGSFAAAPTTDLCSSGTTSPVTTIPTGWTWTCGSGVGLVTGSATRLGPVCGDNTCESGESLLTCPQDCKVKYQQF